VNRYRPAKAIEDASYPDLVDCKAVQNVVMADVRELGIDADQVENIEAVIQAEQSFPHAVAGSGAGGREKLLAGSLCRLKNDGDVRTEALS
jgi:hypothetical protein